MAVFVINGNETDDPRTAMGLISEIWSAYKQSTGAIEAQLAAVKNKANDPAAAHAATGAVLEGSDVAPGSDAS